MRFVELKKHLQSGELFNVYLIKGEDKYVMGLAEKMFLDNLVQDFAELNSSIMYTEDIEPQKVVDMCNMMPFMADKKVVIVRETEKKLAGELANLLKTYIAKPNNSTVLVLVEGEDACFSKLPLEVVDCSRLDNGTLATYIKQKVKNANKQIEDTAVNSLMDYTNCYLGRIENELSKLLSMTNDVITKEDICQNVNKDLEYSIFELTDCISSNNYNRAIEIVNDLMEDYKANKSILGLIKNHFRKLMYISLSNLSTKEIADFLGVKEYAITKSKPTAKTFKKITLVKINKLIDETDYKIKSGKITFETGIYDMILQIFALQGTR